jgi:prepilin-type N-terminal cleavage/methylation domain-containing protein
VNFLPIRRRLSPRSTEGFTLLELMVVILLLSVLLGFAIPAIQGGTFMESRTSAARKIVWAVKNLKLNALTRQETHTLHLDLDAGQIWANRGRLADTTQENRRPDAWALPEGTRIDRIQFPDQDDIRAGIVEIGFYAPGYSDRAIIRLAGDSGDRTYILIETFLPSARILDEDDGAAFGSSR